MHPSDLAGGCSDLEMTWLLYCAGAATVCISGQSSTTLRKEDRCTFQNAKDANNDVSTRKVLHCKQNSVVDFVGTLHFFQDRNDKTNRHELAELVDEIKRCVVDAVPRHSRQL